MNFLSFIVTLFLCIIFQILVTYKVNEKKKIHNTYDSTKNSSVDNPFEHVVVDQIGVSVLRYDDFIYIRHDYMD